MYFYKRIPAVMYMIVHGNKIMLKVKENFLHNFKISQTAIEKNLLIL